jgi:hypothetical protein
MKGRHNLLRGGRWHLARPRSRALWTSATDGEIQDLLDDPKLRAELEELLRRAAGAVDDVESLLVFDDRNVDLLLVIAIVSAADRRCTWQWIARSSMAAGSA